jgi:hypothetical protein
MLAFDRKWLAASRENGDSRTTANQLIGDIGGLVDHVLAVVQDQE